MRLDTGVPSNFHAWKKGLLGPGSSSIRFSFGVFGRVLLTVTARGRACTQGKWEALEFFLLSFFVFGCSPDGALRGGGVGPFGFPACRLPPYLSLYLPLFFLLFSVLPPSKAPSHVYRGHGRLHEVLVLTQRGCAASDMTHGRYRRGSLDGNE